MNTSLRDDLTIEGVNMNETMMVLPDLALRLNMDHPDYEEAYCFGYECAEAGMSEQDNPFRVGKSGYEPWLEGWWAGFYGEEPLFVMEKTLEDTLTVDSITAANDTEYHHDFGRYWSKFLTITGALTATVLIGYQIIDLVA